MTFSLGEIEVMGKRAARGAGLSWGLAEEAGKAARWLCANGLPGADMLAELLSRNDGRCYEDLVPVLVDGVWQARSGQLCPLIAGAALSDLAREIAMGRDINTGPTAFPLLLAPAAAGVAAITDAAVTLSWPGVTIAIGPDGAAIEGEDAAVRARSADGVTCRAASGAVIAGARRRNAAPIDAETWSRLGDFAHRTFAPATEASRLAGAGAGLADND